MFFSWLEATALSIWIRESTSVFAFPGILSAHAIGMGLAAGINAVFALHVLGAAPDVPTKELRRFVPIMWFGFWLNAVSGVLLLIAYPTKALTNPVFYLKLALIAIAMGLYVAIGRRAFGPQARLSSADVFQPSRAIKWCGAVSLVCWAAATTAGRLLAYTYTHLMAGW